MQETPSVPFAGTISACRLRRPHQPLRLGAIFPVYREFTGNFPVSCLVESIWVVERIRISMPCERFPCRNLQGIFLDDQGKSRVETGTARTFQRSSGTRQNPYSLDWVCQSRGTGFRMIFSRVRSAGWCPFRIARWISGDRNASCARVRM